MKGTKKSITFNIIFAMSQMLLTQINSYQVYTNITSNRIYFRTTYVLDTVSHLRSPSSTFLSIPHVFLSVLFFMCHHVLYRVLQDKTRKRKTLHTRKNERIQSNLTVREQNITQNLELKAFGEWRLLTIHERLGRTLTMTHNTQQDTFLFVCVPLSTMVMVGGDDGGLGWVSVGRNVGNLVGYVNSRV